MFQRDDELKKGGRSKSAVLEEARKKRNEREKQRHTEHHAILVQSLIRRFLVRRSLQRQFREDVDRKLRDIATLQQVLQKSFVIPVPVIMFIVHSLLSAVKLSSKHELEKGDKDRLAQVLTLLQSNWTLSEDNYTTAFGNLPINTLKKLLAASFQVSTSHASALQFIEKLVGCSKTPLSQHIVIMKILIHDTLPYVQCPWWRQQRTEFTLLMRQAMASKNSDSWWRILFHLLEHASDENEAAKLIAALVHNILTIPSLEIPSEWLAHLHRQWRLILQTPFNDQACPPSTVTGIPCSVFLMANELSLRPQISQLDTLVMELDWFRELLLKLPDESYNSEPLSWLHVSSITSNLPMHQWCAQCLAVKVQCLRKPLSTTTIEPMFPNSSTDEEKFGFGYIPQQGGFSILSRMWKKKPQWATKLMNFNLFKAPASTKITKQMAATPAVVSGEPFEREAFLALIHMYGVFLFRWKPHSPKNTPEMLSLLSFYRSASRESLVTLMWLFFQENISIDRYAESTSLERCTPTDPFGALLLVLCVTYNNLLIVLDDNEMYEQSFPLPLIEVERVVVFFKQLLYRRYWINGHVPEKQHPFGEYLADSATRLLQTLYNRCSRRPFCNVTSWIIKDLDGDDMLESVLNQDPRGVLLMKHMPYLLPYADRVRLFEALLKMEREANQAQNRPCRIVIRRGYVLEDGMMKLNTLRKDLKRKIQVHFINEAGVEEVGIDAGGLFKEFWTELSQLAFDPHYGLFQCSEDQLMYPNPNSSAIHANDTALFEFLGRILGKALYENIVVQPKFARFFLTKLLGNHNHINDLPSLDAELYKNLMFLKSYDGNVADLGLTFSIGQDCFGVHKDVELFPGSKDVAVTSENRFRYIHLAANYYLNVQIRRQSAAFLTGLSDVMDLRLLNMFNEPELQVLISGTSGAFDLESATTFTGGYFSQDKRIGWLWKALESFSPSERALFLRFVTSCQRAPILGFQSLHPPFCVQKISIRSDDEKLPSASTCFNTLKLPTYSSYKVLREKLLTAIMSGAGFEMT
ncbi:hypothetical protein Ae201684P_005118 [Aphanomyces euteiches]|nr:hypothetical protein Ae201684P_005118 [Aphanomyces euteiches]